MQTGLKCLIEEHKDTVCSMLDDSPSLDGNSSIEEICEACAKVLKQQQLSPSGFLARFFDIELLKQQAELWGKSSKGSAPSLADRIEAAWNKDGMKGPPPKRKTLEKDGGNYIGSSEQEAAPKPAKKQKIDDEKEAKVASGKTTSTELSMSMTIPKKKKKKT